MSLPSDPAHHQTPLATVNNPMDSASNVENKMFNLVIHSIKECLPKTAKLAHLEQDLQNITNVFCEANLTIDIGSIRDCFCLGRYKPDFQHPRPILVKFLRSVDVSIVLPKAS